MFTVVEGVFLACENRGLIIDSGASQHLCRNRASFLDGTCREIGKKGIEIADGSRIEAIGIGSIGIGKLHLTDVLHDPRVRGNLMSVARLIDCGYNVSFPST